ncbi:endo-1 4-beta-xylanase A [Canna indica]|uniref:Endo-1 4-beta-xylanase A n=1 Tax=Canna indica TaxID=4628 RepID=A0AAQ3K378_9LILI|nr:endo-1 4-beta-xylanase A [Canna indica]
MVHVTYQVSTWVHVGDSQRKGPENINVALGVDSQWVNDGQVMAKDERWYEIRGSSKIEMPSVSRTNIDNEDFIAFPRRQLQQGGLRDRVQVVLDEAATGLLQLCRHRYYADIDELLALYKSNDIDVRGHCIFWEVESLVQSWVRSLNSTDLSAAIQNCLSGLLTRYKDQFLHTTSTT